LKDGAWKYHDHVAPYVTGYVIVGRKGVALLGSACKAVSYVVKTCDYLGKQFSSRVPGIRVNCIHGIGHGFMSDPPPPEMYGKPRRMIGKALRTCDSP
jgi:hypothetical protein